MALKKYTEITIKAKFYLPADKTPEMSIEKIVDGIVKLGGKDVKQVGNKLTNEIPS
jgi:hypothetical protein